MDCAKATDEEHEMQRLAGQAMEALSPAPSEKCEHDLGDYWGYQHSHKTDLFKCDHPVCPFCPAPSEHDEENPSCPLTQVTSDMEIETPKCKCEKPKPSKEKS